MKPHFPFHRAYELAEDLLRSAKDVKRKVKNEQGRPVPCSALDFHVHFDSSGADLGRIRDKLEAEGACLTAKPYVVTKLDGLSAAEEDGRDWVGLRLWEGDAKRSRSGLLDAAEAFARKGGRDDEKSLPRNQQHYLREGLFLGREAANGRLSQIAHRYNGFAWATLHPERKTGTLFFVDPTDDKENERRVREDEETIERTWFLDALELAELRGAPEQENASAAQAQADAAPMASAGEGATEPQAGATGTGGADDGE